LPQSFSHVNRRSDQPELLFCGSPLLSALFARSGNCLRPLEHASANVRFLQDDLSETENAEGRFRDWRVRPSREAMSTSASPIIRNLLTMPGVLGS
jgi:hypothetical protein